MNSHLEELGVLQAEIEELKRTNRLLEEEKSFYRTLIETSPYAIALLDSSGKIKIANHKAAEIVGHQNAENLIGKSYLNFAPTDETATFQKRLKSLVDQGGRESISATVSRRDGTTLETESSSTVVKNEQGEIQGIIVFVRDVTERKKAEKQIRFLAEILEAAPLSVKATNASGEIIYVNSATVELFGYPKEEILGKNPGMFNAEPDAEEIQIDIVNTVLSGKVWTGEILNRKKNGEIFPIAANIYSLRDSNDELLALVGFQEDITEARQAQEALQQERDNLINVFDAMQDGVCIVDRHHQVLYANQVLEQTFGPWKGLKCHAYLDNRDEAHPWCKNKEILNGGKARWEWSPPATSRTYDILETPVRDSEGNNSVLAIFRDVTERKRAEIQLKSLASQLSLAEEKERRRIATELHDNVGQILATAKMRLSRLPGRQDRGEFKEEVGQVKQLCDQAIAFTRSLTFQLSLPVLYEVGLEAAVEWLAKNINEQHGLQAEVSSDKKPKPLDDDIRVLLFQSVRELFNNVCRHARASRMTVSITRESADIRIAVEDDGAGFDVSARGESDGFGLFNIRERLTSVGGTFDLRSSPGQGTRIVITAPLKDMEDAGGG